MSLLVVIFSATWSQVCRTYPNALYCAVCLVTGWGVVAVTVLAGGANCHYEMALFMTYAGYASIVAWSPRWAGSCFISSTLAYDLGCVATHQTGALSTWLSKNATLWGCCICATVGVVLADRLRKKEFLQRLRADDSTKQLRDVFANVNHELRTPLMLILASIEELKDGSANADDNARQYEITRRNSLRLLRLVDDLLELSRLNSALPSLHVGDHDLAQLARELVGQMQPMAGRKGITLAYTGCQSAIVGIDASAIDRVLNNLMTNALKFTPSGGRITVDVVDGDPLSFAVSDTGGGISDDDKKHIFERFYQGASGKKAKIGGIGIGLSMCKRIIELHGGTIAAEDAPVSGTIMRVGLPKQPTTDAQVAVSTTTLQATTDGRAGLPEWDQAIRQDKEYKYGVAQQATERRAVPRSLNEDILVSSVLVVEDNFDMQDLIAGALRGRHKVFVAADGQEGLALARRLRPDVIVSDVTMPVMDGFTLLEHARTDAQLRDTPFVLITARGDASDRLTSDQKRADAFLEKPFKNRDILAIVDRLVERQRDLGKQAALSSTMSHRIIAAGLAHDIANPLLFTKNALFIIRKFNRVLVDTQADEAKRTAAKDKTLQALRSADNGVERIEECLNLLRKLHDGQDMAPPVPLDINYIVERTLAITAVTSKVKPDLQAKNKVMLSPGQLDRVLFNLIINAIEAGGADCPIEVTSSDSENNRFVRITVKDGGPGMDNALLAKVTEPYFSTKDRGSGLGLAMCKRIVEDHGGALTITSTIGVGSHFMIDLPSAPPLTSPIAVIDH